MFLIKVALKKLNCYNIVKTMEEFYGIPDSCNSKQFVDISIDAF